MARREPRHPACCRSVSRLNRTGGPLTVWYRPMNIWFRGHGGQSHARLLPRSGRQGTHNLNR